MLAENKNNIAIINTNSNYLSKRRILGLDILRFVAAIGVLMYHYFFIGPLEGYWGKENFLLPAFIGEFGVDLFFVLSGIVIIMSCEGKSTVDFIKSRFLRIYPAFIICSIFTAVLAIFMPNTDLKNIIFRLFTSQTFFSDLFNVEPLTSVYWTLMVEVKFYILVAFVMRCNIWRENKYGILFIWLLIGIANTFYFHNKLIEVVFVSKYAGHFVAGILCYLKIKGEKHNFMYLGFTLSLLLIFNSCKSYYLWISSLTKIQLTDIQILFIALAIVSIVYWAASIKEVLISAKMVKILGATSYTLYLIHSDLGYFIRVKFYQYIALRIPNRYVGLSEDIIATIAIGSSICIAVVIAMYIEPFLRNKFKKIFELRK